MKWFRNKLDMDGIVKIVNKQGKFSMSKNLLLPEQFSHLENQLQWAKATSKDRWRVRATSSMSELQIFYDAVAPHMEPIMAYLADFPPNENELEPPVLRLIHLAKAFMEVSLSIELLHVPDEPMVWSVEHMELDSN